MSLSRNDLTEVVLREEYEVNLLTIAEIEKKYHTSDTTVTKLLSQFNIPQIRRSRKSYQAMNTLTEKILRTEHIDNFLSISKIAQKYNTTADVVEGLLEKYNIPKYALRNNSRIFSILTEDVLRQEYEVNLLTMAEIEKKYHVRDEVIAQLLDKYGIEKIRDRTFRKRADLKLTPIQEQLVYGSLCGAAGVYADINNHTTSCSFEVSHTMKHVDYVLWKRDILKEWIPFEEPYKLDKSCTPENPDKYHPSAMIYTFVAPIFNELRELFYPNGIKVISTKVLEPMNELALAVWFMDDGSRNSKIIHISGKWTDQELSDIRTWFNDRWDIEIDKVAVDNEGSMDLVFNKVAACTLANIVRPYIVPCMEYKIEGIGIYRTFN